MGGGSVHRKYLNSVGDSSISLVILQPPNSVHGILGAAREHLLIGTVTNMASTASLSQCM